MHSETFSVSIIIPVHNHAPMLHRCLEHLQRHVRSGDEIIVVDDASTDSSASVAESFGCRVVRADQRRGPGAARNLGAEAANEEILVFLDADVCVHPDTLARLCAPLEDVSVGAVFGSYDDVPVAPQLVSQFRNLWHHHVHQTAGTEASTFWAGCGAVRRSLFFDVQGFDPTFKYPSVEDIDLGRRLCRAGFRIVVSKDAQVTHLKRWTLRTMCSTDLWRRGVPWSGLILREKTLPNELNLKRSQRLSVVLACLLLAAFCVLAWGQPWILVIPVVALFAIQVMDAYPSTQPYIACAAAPITAGALCLSAAVHGAAALVVGVSAGLGVWSANAGFYSLLGRTKGRAFALAAFPLHLIFYLICAAAVVVALTRHLATTTWQWWYRSRTPVQPESSWPSRSFFGWRPGPRPDRLAGFLQGTAWLAVMCVAVGAYQYATGAYRADFYHEDAPAHFVTGVMIADYVRSGLGENPVAFAEHYYVRSPKVAFGHWPPLFHFVEGAWYLVWGASKTSAILLVGAITVTAVFVLFRRLQKLYGTWIAVLGGLTFVSFPAVGESTRMVMCDMLALLLCMLSAFAAADFIATRRTRYMVLTILYSLLAVLTKENALHLLVLLPALFISADDWSLLRDRRLYGSFLLILAAVVALVALKVASGSSLHGYFSLRQLLREMVRVDDSGRIVSSFFQVASPIIFAIAAAGALAAFLRPQDTLPYVRWAVVWLAAILAFFLIAPAPPDRLRYYMPALVPLTFLCAHAYNSLRELFVHGLKWRVAAQPLTSTACMTALLACSQPPAEPTFGYAPVARSIPIYPDTIMLVSSDAHGEGAFVAERLMADRAQAGIVLRASKVLASSNWIGGDYKLRQSSADEVYKYLQQVPVHYIVLDYGTAPGKPVAPHRELLRRTLEEHTDCFRRLKEFVPERGSRHPNDPIVVYKNLGAADQKPGTIRLDLSYTLRRAIEVDVTDCGDGA